MHPALSVWIISTGSIYFLNSILKFLFPPAVSIEFGNPVSFASIITPTDRDLVRSLGILLGAGESEAIALAIEKKAQVILDDKKARAIAEEMGLLPIGTVGILLKAKIADHILSLREALDDLEKKGFFISTFIKQEALRIAKEL